MSCQNMTTQTYPKGWDYKTAPIKCGQTGYYGKPIICASCHNAAVLAERAKKKPAFDYDDRLAEIRKEDKGDWFHNSH